MGMIVYEEIQQAFSQAQEIVVYSDGDKRTYESGDKEYTAVLDCWYGLLDKSRQMPAYGVSLDRETRKELEKGLWLEFIFDGSRKCFGMPFSKLLISVKAEHFGFNVIRYDVTRGYDGRCFYIDLDGKNMQSIYDLLLKL